MKRYALLTIAIAALTTLALFAQDDGDEVQPGYDPEEAQDVLAREPDSEGIVDWGSVVVDVENRRITLNGYFNIENGVIEYLVTSDRGKRHESLFYVPERGPVSEVGNARLIHAGLLLCEAEPGRGPRQRGEAGEITGAPVQLEVAWKDEAGEEHSCRIEDLVYDRAMERPMPHIAWTFTGSRFVRNEHTGREFYMADWSGNMFAVYRDPDCMIDNPLPGGFDGSGNRYMIVHDTVPALDTACTITITALDPADVETPDVGEPTGNSEESERYRRETDPTFNLYMDCIWDVLESNGFDPEEKRRADGLLYIEALTEVTEEAGEHIRKKLVAYPSETQSGEWELVLDVWNQRMQLEEGEEYWDDVSQDMMTAIRLYQAIRALIAERED